MLCTRALGYIDHGSYELSEIAGSVKDRTADGVNVPDPFFPVNDPVNSADRNCGTIQMEVSGWRGSVGGLQVSLRRSIMAQCPQWETRISTRPKGRSSIK
jgi:hypothetical protein